MVVLPTLCKKFSDRFLQMRAFSSGLMRGPSYGGRSRMQEKSVFSCTVVSEKAGCGSKHVDPHILLAYHVLQTDYTPGIRVLPTCRSHVRMNVDGYYEEGLARICDPRGKFRLRSLLW